MTRRILTAVAAAMLLMASLQAPSAHVHPGDPEHQHAKGFAHTHFAVQEDHDDGLEIEAPHGDELAIFLEWAPAAAQRVVVTYVVAPSPLAVEPVLARVGSAPEFAPRANSPPSVRLIPARAPPL